MYSLILLAHEQASEGSEMIDILKGNYVTKLFAVTEPYHLGMVSSFTKVYIGRDRKMEGKNVRAMYKTLNK